MSASELNAAVAWEAWRQCAAQFSATHRVYGVALHAAGDTVFQLTPADRIERITGGGLLAADASTADLALLDRCIADGNFMVCIQERRPSATILRVYPAKTEGWSIKSLHPSKGGSGLIAATVIR